jgi:uncharacterized protein (DUF697 family)
LLVTGDLAAAEALARTLSERPGSEGVHPWVHLAGLPWAPDEPRFQPDVALVVTHAADHGLEAQAAIRQLNRRGVPVIAVVSGEDALRRTGAELAREGEYGRVVLPDPSQPATTAASLFPTLLAALTTEEQPDPLLALGKQLPVFRDVAVAELIEDTARANAVYSFTTGLGEIVPGLTIPLVIGDTIILTKNQLLMAYKIAVVAGKHGDPSILMGEVAGVIGGGVVARQVARELVGLIPVIGIIPKVAVSYAGTRVIGSIVHVWAVEDRRPGKEEIRAFYRTAAARGRALAQGLIDNAHHFREDRKDRKARKALPPPEPAVIGGPL